MSAGEQRIAVELTVDDINFVIASLDANPQRASTMAVAMLIQRIKDQAEAAVKAASEPAKKTK